MSIEGKTDQDGKTDRPKFRPAELRVRGDEPMYPADGAVLRFWQGITIREHFAGLAMQGLLARGDQVDDDLIQEASWCAEALLAELAGEAEGGA